MPVVGGAVCLQREDHALLYLHGILERVQPADDRPLVQRYPEPVAELERERFHLAVEPELLRLRPHPGDLVGAYPWLDELNRCVDPLASLFVSVALALGGASDVERSVVAGAIPVERLDDVEEGLVSRSDQPV